MARLALDARLQGSIYTAYHGDCSNNVEIMLFGLPDKLLADLGIEAAARANQRILVRCRKCPECLAHRTRVWTARAVAETVGSVRTWFGTLTLHPDRATQARMSADRALTDAISDRSDPNYFNKMVDSVNPELTKFLKRVRKNSDARLRYMLVAEPHKSGMPHWHILIHEQSGVVTKRELEAAWRYGFSHWRLDPFPSNDMYGRSGFYIHGDNPRGDKSASEGCIILARPIREAVEKSYIHGRQKSLSRRH